MKMASQKQEKPESNEWQWLKAASRSNGVTGAAKHHRGKAATALVAGEENESWLVSGARQRRRLVKKPKSAFFVRKLCI